MRYRELSDRRCTKKIDRLLENRGNPKKTYDSVNLEVVTPEGVAIFAFI